MSGLKDMEWMSRIRPSKEIKESVGLNKAFAKGKKLEHMSKEIDQALATRKGELKAFLDDEENIRKASYIKKEGENLLVPIRMIGESAAIISDWLKYYLSLVELEKVNQALTWNENLAEYLNNANTIEGLDNLQEIITQSETLLSLSMGAIGTRKANQEDAET